MADKSCVASFVTLSMYLSMPSILNVSIIHLLQNLPIHHL